MGSNPNAEYDWNWHPELPRTVLWGALIATGQPELAELLLKSGANPTDGVSTHVAAGRRNISALELLYRFAVNVNGVPRGVPPLPYILGLIMPVDIYGGIMLLEHTSEPM